LNGAAARKAHVGDLLIICTYGPMSEADAKTFIPKVILVDDKNKIKEIKKITL
jgi:aspartate 1-decarboxylase